MSTPIPRRYASLDDAAEYAGCGARTIRRLISAGELTGYRLGKRLLRINLDELDAAMRPVPSAGDAA